MAKFHGGKRVNAGRPKVGRLFFPIRVLRQCAAEIDRICFERSQAQNRSVSRGEIIEEKFEIFPSKNARGSVFVVVF